MERLAKVLCLIPVCFIAMELVVMSSLEWAFTFFHSRVSIRPVPTVLICALVIAIVIFVAFKSAGGLF